MRAALAIATALTATSLVGVSAPAQATTCTATVSGWDISHIVLKNGATCDHAKQVIHHVFRVHHGPAAMNWRCNEPSSTSWKQYSCWALNHSGHAIEFLAHEQGSTGGF